MDTHDINVNGCRSGIGRESFVQGPLLCIVLTITCLAPVCGCQLSYDAVVLAVDASTLLVLAVVVYKVVMRCNGWVAAQHAP